MRISDWSSDVCSSDLLDGEIEALVRWHPFELNSDMPPEGEDQALHIQRKYRRTAEEGVAVRAQMRSIAEGAGVSLDYEGDRKRVGKGKSVSVRVDRGGRRSLKKNNTSDRI